MMLGMQMKVCVDWGRILKSRYVHLGGDGLVDGLSQDLGCSALADRVANGKVGCRSAICPSFRHYYKIPAKTVAVFIVLALTVCMRGDSCQWHQSRWHRYFTPIVTYYV